MHRTIAEQGLWLGQVVKGYFRCFAVPTNDGHRARRLIANPLSVLNRRRADLTGGLCVSISRALIDERRGPAGARVRGNEDE